MDGRGVLGQGVKAGTGESVSQELGFRHGELAFAQAIITPWAQHSSRTSWTC